MGAKRRYELVWLAAKIARSYGVLGSPHGQFSLPQMVDRFQILDFVVLDLARF